MRLFARKSLYLVLLFFALSISQPHAAYKELTITEVLPDPAGTDTGKEFVELINTSSNDIDITQYRIYNKPILPFGNEESPILLPGETIVVHHKDHDIKLTFPGNYKRASITGLQIINDGGSVMLTDSLSNHIDTFDYPQASSSKSFVRPDERCEEILMRTSGNSIGVQEDPNDYLAITSEDFNLESCIHPEVFVGDKWSRVLEVENQSIIDIRINYPEWIFGEIETINWLVDAETYNTNPIAITSNPPQTHSVSFDLETTSGQNVDSLGFSIESSGVVPTPTPTPTPTITITPTPTPSPSPTPTITITPTPSPTPSPSPTPTVTPSPTPSITPSPTPVPTYTDIRINEILPDPTSGSEWVEIYNYGTQSINLNTIKIADATSTPRTLPNIVLAPNSYHLLQDTALGVSLNNSGDTIYLYTLTSQTPFQTTTYTTIPKGYSHAKFDSIFKITTTPTPGTANIYTPVPSDDSDNENDGGNNNNDNTTTQPPSLTLKTIDQIRTSALNSKVKTKGIVTSPVGQLAQGAFYIQDSKSGIKCKFKSNTTTPDLKIGDLVELTGELRESTAEKYIYIDSSVSKTGSGSVDPIAVSETPMNLETLEGMLVQFEGEITSNFSTSFDLTNSDNTIRISIQTSTGIDSVERSKGDRAKIVGVLSQYKTSSSTSDGYRILPRAAADIEIQIQETPATTTQPKTSTSTTKKTTNTVKSTNTTSKLPSGTVKSATSTKIKIPTSKPTRLEKILFQKTNAAEVATNTEKNPTIAETSSITSKIAYISSALGSCMLMLRDVQGRKFLSDSTSTTLEYMRQLKS